MQHRRRAHGELRHAPAQREVAEVEHRAGVQPRVGAAHTHDVVVREVAMDRLHGELSGDGPQELLGRCDHGRHPVAQRRVRDRRQQVPRLVRGHPHVPHLRTVQPRVLQRGESVHRGGGEGSELPQHDRREVAGVDHRLALGEGAAPHREAAPALRQRAVAAGKGRGHRHAGPAVGVERGMLGVPRTVRKGRVVDPEHAAGSVGLGQQEVAVLVAAELGCRDDDAPELARDRDGIGGGDVGAHESPGLFLHGDSFVRSGRRSERASFGERDPVRARGRRGAARASGRSAL